MSVDVLPKFPIPGFEDMDPQEAANLLHEEKNTPFQAWREARIKFPAYRYRPFPTCLYRHWTEVNKRRELMRLVGANGIPMDDTRQIQMLEDGIAEYETLPLGVNDVADDGTVNESLRAKNEAALLLAKGQGWANTPFEVKAAERRLNDAVANAAAERTWDDRHLGGVAREELNAVEAASDLHVVDIPEVPRRGPGRPRKDEA